MAGKRYALAVVEVRTAVSLCSLGPVLSHYGSDMSCMHMDSDDLARSTTAYHLAQLALQMVFTSFNFSIYICCVEIGVVYTIILYCPNTALNDMQSSMATYAGRVRAWAHEDGFPICFR